LVRERALITAGTLVCDIGCGYGATSRLLAGSGADVTAMTISAAQFAVAQERHGTTANLRFILGDWLANELPSESFDAAIAIESSEHMPDKPLFFHQAGRVLRRDGRLAICAWLAAEKLGHWAKNGCWNQSVAKAACRILAAPANTSRSPRAQAFASRNSRT
ncbi:MAG: class I SAM-dependent methyltransferase, partial [Verrucomicrobiota bacterium]|nr:class I SAM-dependent methyltransferase [Verrucomicrobiota bacterium]